MCPNRNRSGPRSRPILTNMPTMKVGIAGGVLLTTMILTVLAGSYPHDVPHQVTVPGGCTVTFGPIRRIGVLTAVSAPVTGDQYGKPRPTPTLVHVRSVREQVQRESDHRDSPYATTIYDAYGDYSGTPEDVSLGTVWGPDHDDLLSPPFSRVWSMSTRAPPTSTRPHTFWPAATSRSRRARSRRCSASWRCRSSAPALIRPRRNRPWTRPRSFRIRMRPVDQCPSSSIRDRRTRQGGPARRVSGQLTSPGNRRDCRPR